MEVRTVVQPLLKKTWIIEVRDGDEHSLVVFGAHKT